MLPFLLQFVVELLISGIFFSWTSLLFSWLRFCVVVVVIVVLSKLHTKRLIQCCTNRSSLFHPKKKLFDSHLFSPKICFVLCLSLFRINHTARRECFILCTELNARHEHNACSMKRKKHRNSRIINSSKSSRSSSNNNSNRNSSSIQQKLVYWENERLSEKLTENTHAHKHIHARRLTLRQTQRRTDCLATLDAFSHSLEMRSSWFVCLPLVSFWAVKEMNAPFVVVSLSFSRSLDFVVLLPLLTVLTLNIFICEFLHVRCTQLHKHIYLFGSRRLTVRTRIMYTELNVIG